MTDTVYTTLLMDQAGRRLPGKQPDWGLLGKWVKENEVALVPTNVWSVCVDRLANKSGKCQCRRSNRWEHPTRCHLPVLTDHTSLWLKEGKPYIYVSQPYTFGGIDDKDVAILEQFCKKNNLTLTIKPETESWYYPNKTSLIEIKRATIAEM